MSEPKKPETTGSDRPAVLKFDKDRIEDKRKAELMKLLLKRAAKLTW